MKVKPLIIATFALLVAVSCFGQNKKYKSIYDITVKDIKELTYGYKDSGGYHLVLLVDYGFAFSPEGVIASLVAHEMIHAYCDHSNLPAGESFHEQWFDYIASAVEEQSLKYGYDPFYFYLRNIYRD